MTDWIRFRSWFPALERQVWVNAAAASPIPIPVHDAVRRFWDEVLLSGDRRLASWLAGAERARRLLAETIGGDPSEVAFVPSTSHAMNLVGHLLRQAGIRRAVTLATEFPATTLPLLHQGIELVFVEPRGGRYDLDRIEDAIGPGVGALVASHVQFSLGYAADLEALGSIARRRGVPFVINATQSLGARPVDVGRAGADFLVATGHKWLCAGFGTGMLWLRRHWLRHRLPLAGWLSAIHAQRMENRTLELRDDARVAEIGSSSLEVPLRIGAALELLHGAGIDAIHRRILSLTDRLRAGLRQRGIEPLTPDDPAIRSGITSFASPDAEGVVERLATAGVIASARRGAVRIALHAYNDERDVDRTLEALGN